MARLNLKAIEERVARLGARESYNRDLIFDLLLAYGKPKGNITRLRNGSLNVAADPGREIAQKGVVYFREVAGEPLAEIEELRKAAHAVRFNPRFVIVTDYAEFIAVDMKTGDNLAIPIHDIDKHFTFFLPWAGMEKAQYVAEAHADVKAAERMGKLFDELLAANPDLMSLPHGRHALNVFFTRLLFCFFAEDTGIFTDNQFTNAVGSHTLTDGSDVNDFLSDLFTALDTEKRADKPTYLADFPYVNGQLFAVKDAEIVPAFTRAARQQLIDLGTLIWQEINPDIFGSMFQSIVTPGTRSDLGQHYTSVPNILKTIEPLFLNELKEQLDAGFDSVRKLETLLDRISEVKIFDPACGSGNFLVIAYKELRKLEHAILERLAELDSKHQVLFAESRINIENFYGIEIDDFAVEVAVLSLWIAKHQMNTEFREKFNVSIPLIPLREAGQITAGNANRIEWNSICPNDRKSEIYLIGNPPYYGAKKQTADQKADYAFAFAGAPYSKNLNYVALWFTKGADYIRNSRAQLAFVTTDSVVQGEHVGMMFPALFAKGLEIGYAYTPFKWANNAKRNAGVTVAVISLRNISKASKYLYIDGLRVNAENINGYLVDASNIIVKKSSKPQNDLPPMNSGSMPIDGGNLILNKGEADRLMADPVAAGFVKKFVGTKEFVDGIDRFALWISDEDVADALGVPEISQRISRVRDFRESRERKETKKLAQTPWRFGFRSYSPEPFILVPKSSSERRDYLPIGMMDSDTLISDLAFAIYGAELWLFSLITSRTHMAWARSVGGKFKEDPRYSNTLVYNTFPLPPISNEIKEQLTMAAFRILDVREYHSEKTLVELYDPDKMPEDLRAAHNTVDVLVDSIYSKKPYETDEDRLSDLFALYEKRSAEEETKEPTKKGRK